MADKELRKMNRTELIEIIYAFQQNEKDLIKEKEELQEQLNDRILRIESSGSIAEAALRVNGIIEAAQVAADDYLASVKAAYKDSDTAAQRIILEARKEAEDIRKEAVEIQKKAEEDREQVAILLAEAKMKNDKADHLLKKAEEQYELPPEKLLELVRTVLIQNPELARALIDRVL